MTRLIFATVGLYVLAAVISRATEPAGMRHCDCLDTCWCKKPGLSLFRWVTRRNRHHLPGEYVVR
jgi:hypothetical protein